jgi:tripartite-type tricarboxylate transporter receptor subunit TctC
VPIWFSLWAPAGTSKEIAGILGHKISEISRTPEMIQRMRDMSVVPVIQTPEEVLAFFERDWEANAQVIRDAKIKLD